ncbi:MAG: hypothetical protein J6V58_01705 [Clostridia bacterium]|nr:hypothetical protein [Clostridia bacterium]
MSIPFTNDRLLSNSMYEFNIDRWYGLNTRQELAKNGECVSMENINCNGSYLFPRKPRKLIKSNINNPQRILFCGENLSYISDGQLFVNDNKEFVNKGDVGNVSSVVNFSNREVLFYPSNSKYNLTDGTLSTVTEYLETGFLETENFEDRYIMSTYRIEKAKKNNDITGYAIYLKANSSRVLNLPPLENDDGTPKLDEEGNPLYGSVTFNATGIPEKLTTNGDYDFDRYNLRLIVYRVDDAGTQVGDAKLCKFGEEVSFSNASKIAADVVVYYYGQFLNDNAKKCKTEVNNLLSNKDFKVWLTNSSYPAPNSCPHIEFACMDNNRVFGVSKNNIYASSLGNYANWTDFVDADGSPKTTGAYAEELYSLGDFTGVYKYKSYIVITKKDLLYECYGNKPPYRTTLSGKTGCIDQRSMVEVNNVLYWLGIDGVYRYAGSVPVKISENIDNLFKNYVGGVASTDGKNYYISIYDGEVKRLMVYDTDTGLWCMEDCLDIVDMTNYNNTVYALTKSGDIVEFGNGDEIVEWEYQTKVFDFDIKSKKIIRNLFLGLFMDSMAKVDVYVKYDNGGYERIATYISTDSTDLKLKLKVKKCNSFSLMIKGVGYSRVNSLSGTIVMKHRNNSTGGIITY